MPPLIEEEVLDRVIVSMATQPKWTLFAVLHQQAAVTCMQEHSHACAYMRQLTNNHKGSHMASVLLPLIKLVGPFVTQIATVAIPAFTSRPDTIKSDPILARQIEELQAAATQNAQSIHVLAEKMQLAIQGIEGAAEAGRTQIAAYKTMLFVSLSLAAASFITCVYLLAR